MTATPIPRSLAMTVYGDLDVSVIDEMPPGRTPIVTRVFADNADDRKQVKQLLQQELLAADRFTWFIRWSKSQKRWTCAMRPAAMNTCATKYFHRFSVGLLHGRMKPEEKEEVMRRFVCGRDSMLVSTTVIEVGVDVPNASVMVVEHARTIRLVAASSVARTRRPRSRAKLLRAAGF